jgi:uncharacterized protein (TIGR03067 family)
MAQRPSLITLCAWGRIPTWVLLAATLAAGFAPVPARKPDAKKLLAAMQGTWEMTRESDVGHGTWAKDTRIFVRVRGKAWQYLFYTGVFESEGTPSEVTVAAQGGLMTIDLNLTPPDERRNVLRGIIKLEGDALTVCHSPDTGERPGAFSGWSVRKDGKAFHGRTMTFKKVK